MKNSSLRPSEEDLEQAYDDFFFAGEGPEEEGDVDDEGNDGGLARTAALEAEGIDLSEEGFHIVDENEAASLRGAILAGM